MRTETEGRSNGVSVSTVRETNLQLVLRTVRELAPCSRAAVASATGLNKTTASSLVADLMARGLVRETGETSQPRVGRPGVLLALDDTSLAAIGVEINVDYLSAVAVDLLGRELATRHVHVDARTAGPEASVRLVAETVRETASAPELAGRRIVGVSVAVPGLVDPSGTVTLAPNLGWRNVPLRDRLTALLDDPELPTQVDNDGNLGVMAEFRDGACAGTPDLVYVTGEIGVGAGVLSGGTLLRGASGSAGEIGHLCLDPDGPECACGRRGCLEALAGIGTIVAAAVPDLAAGGRPWTGPEVAGLVEASVRRAQEGDAAAVAAMERAGTWLGRGLAGLANVVDPGVVVLGGYFVPMGPWLLPNVRAALAEHTFAPDAGGCRVELSELGLGAAARGGAAAMVHALDTGRLPLPEPAGARGK